MLFLDDLLSLKIDQKSHSRFMLIFFQFLKLAEYMTNHITESAELLLKGHMTERNNFD